MESPYEDELHAFLKDEKKQELIFPSTLSSTERKKIHVWCEKFGFSNRSVGEGSNRHIVVFKNPLQKFTRDNLTLSLRKRLALDHNFPIPVFQSPYYDYFMDMYDHLYNTKEKEAWLLDALDKMGETEYWKKLESVKKDLISQITSTVAYKVYSSPKNELPEFDIPHEWPKPKNLKKEFYSPSQAGKIFISLDIKSANFNVFKLFNPEIILNCNSYEELLEKSGTTNIKYFQKSKNIRQQFFGCLKTKKWTKMIHYMTMDIYRILLENSLISIEDPCFLNLDEIILETPNESRAREVAKSIKEGIFFHFGKYSNIVQVDVVHLVRLGECPYYVREVLGENGVVSLGFKCIPGHFFAQCYKFYFNLEVNENDKKVEFEKLVCTIDEPLFPRKQTKPTEY